MINPIKLPIPRFSLVTRGVLSSNPSVADVNDKNKLKSLLIIAVLLLDFSPLICFSFGVKRELLMLKDNLVLRRH